MYHGSHDANLTEIEDDGLFGGVFAAGNDGVARSHGRYVYEINSPRKLTDFELNYQIKGAWSAALEIAGGDGSIAEAIMRADCSYENDDADIDDEFGLDLQGTLGEIAAKLGYESISEFGWDLQRMRGALAAKLGYTSVEMKDEHGTTWLCLPGCSITKIDL
jgi:hypothetical protein